MSEPSIVALVSRVETANGSRKVVATCTTKSLLNAVIRWQLASVDRTAVLPAVTSANYTTSRTRAFTTSNLEISHDLLRHGALNVTCVATNILGRRYRDTIIEGTCC